MRERIEPPAEGEVQPPCGGSWLREADGGLRPRDEATAKDAGLDWPAPKIALPAPKIKE